MPSRVKVNEYMSCENSGEKPGIRNLMQQHSKKPKHGHKKGKKKISTCHLHSDKN
jgi:hypothetical protein